jgi:prevent-host-death family protein
MRSVKISKLKAQLSAHIQMVSKGEEVLVCDRNKPVARIIPCSPGDYPRYQERLIARGVLKPPLKERNSKVSWPLPPGNVTREAMRDVWQQEREES